MGSLLGLANLRGAAASLAAVLGCLCLVLVPMDAVAQALPQQEQASDPEGRTKVVGGREANIRDWPWFGTLRYNDSRTGTSGHVCGGTSIAPDWFLTAAHCVASHLESQSLEGVYPDDRNAARSGILEVVLGLDDLINLAMPSVHPIAEVLVHESYLTAYKDARAKGASVGQANDLATTQGGNDVALIRLLRPWTGPVATLSSSADSDPKPEDRSELQVAGHGYAARDVRQRRMRRYIRANGQVYFAGTSRLLAAKLPMIDTSRCHARYASKYNRVAIGPEQICAGMDQGDTRDSCSGDSGGPLIARSPQGQKFQIGIVSWGEGCAEPTWYGVYTRVSAHVDWIKTKIGASSSIVTVPSLTTTVPGTALSFRPTQLARSPLEVAGDLAECGRGEGMLKDSLSILISRLYAQRITDKEITEWGQYAWSTNGMEATYVRLVSEAADLIYSKSSIKTLMQSLVSASIQNQLITSVTETVFASPEFRYAVERMAVSLSRRIGERVGEILTAEHGVIARCIQLALGASYGDEFARLLTTDLALVTKATLEPRISGPRGAGLVIGDAWSAGLGLVIVRLREKIVHSVLGALAKSMVGRMAAKVVPGIGLFLIAKDVWELRKGALPIIADKLVEREVLTEIRTQVVRDMSEAAASTAGLFSRGAAETIFERWVEVRNSYRHVVDFASRSSEFRAFLAENEGTDVATIERVVAFVVRHERNAGIVERLQDRSLTLQVIHLSPTAMAIGDELRSVGEAIDWQALAGDAASEVRRIKLHTLLKSSETDRNEVALLLALPGATLVHRVAALDRLTRTLLLELETSKLQALVDNLDNATLRKLPAFTARLSREGEAYVRKQLFSDPARLGRTMGALDAVLRSRNQLQALELVSEASVAAALLSLPTTLIAAYEGEVSVGILTYRYQSIAILLGLIALGCGLATWIVRRCIRLWRGNAALQ